MSKLTYLVIAIIAPLTLAACSGEPWTLSQSSDQITMRWYAGDVPEGTAAADAGTYCMRLGKAVELGSIERDGSASIGHYRCV
ncbi:MAG TPA: hypothetical protein VME45_02705 [Stellaceae bacterium]|nr:hypothetical protein [Stellaceae bacterium]